MTFGFDSALTIATDAIDRLHTTANSHRRVMVIEIMGHHAGWLALYAGMAGGGDVILVPEIDYDINKVVDYLKQRSLQGKPFSIIVVAEGIKKEGNKTAARYISKKIQELSEFEVRETILGYIQRGGSPSAVDRIFSTQLGGLAADLIYQENFGQMVAMRDGKITHVPLDEVGGKLRLLTPNHPVIQRGRSIGVCFGN
jgi:6-phosphofructokinase